MPKSTIKELAEVLRSENIFLRCLLDAGRVTKEDLEEIKKFQERKRPLIEKILKLDNKDLLLILDDVKELTKRNLRNKDLLLSLIEKFSS
ncbi:hypothetical protein C7457_0445 [Thermovibrio guaymasensis]|uniref:Uncharacterized protein n=1 Tax=Thermovibrio guaymasensis TaxID=240167 RepID=A0A420W8C9_9BACT|nr:hypothetical protein [Thermovibrio guaymasensis]RKQ63571.1 hypothetical protein C7457_0445 [Thermovibrio guaymasensis]